MPLGADSFESIGIPPGVSRSEFESATPFSRLGKWQSAVGEYFPNTGSNNNDSDDNDSDFITRINKQRLQKETTIMKDLNKPDNK